MPDFPKLPIITPPPRIRPSSLETADRHPRPAPDVAPGEKYTAASTISGSPAWSSPSLHGGRASPSGSGRPATIWAGVYGPERPETCPESERIEAAWALSRHPAANDRQRIGSALDRKRPAGPLARYVVAEGLTPEAIRADPKGYALMVAKSEGWPDWLRLLLVRPLAYGGSRARDTGSPGSRSTCLRKNPRPGHRPLGDPHPRFVSWPSGDASPHRSALADAAAKSDGPYPSPRRAPRSRRRRPMGGRTGQASSTRQPPGSGPTIPRRRPSGKGGRKPRRQARRDWSPFREDRSSPLEIGPL